MVRNEARWSGEKHTPSDDQVQRREALREKIGRDDFPEVSPEDLGGYSDDERVWLTFQDYNVICKKLDDSNAGRR